MRTHPLITTAPSRHHRPSRHPSFHHPFNSIHLSGQKIVVFEDSKNRVKDGRTNGQMDGWTDRPYYRDARTQLRKCTYLFHVACVAASSTMYRPSLFSLERSMPGFVNDANGHIKCLDLDVQPNSQKTSSSVLCSKIKNNFWWAHRLDSWQILSVHDCGQNYSTYRAQQPMSR